MRSAAFTLLVTRPQLADIAVLAGVADSLRDVRANVHLVCVGNRPYHPYDVANHVGLPLAGIVADDPRSARQLLACDANARSSRTALVRSVLALAQNLAVGNPPPSAVTPSNLVGIGHDQ